MALWKVAHSLHKLTLKDKLKVRVLAIHAATLDSPHSHLC